tara:strand:+ start:218 stop:790 length:573 start_codon:yes stop_codon:yes gene_type:complete
MKPLVISIFFLSLFTQAIAHKPILIESSTYPVDSPYEIEEPEISKTFFATLSGDPHYYLINSKVDFDFYAGVIVPMVGECILDKKISFEVLDSNLNQMYLANSKDFEWDGWYEEYSSKWYWRGPEIGKDFVSNRIFKAGIYFIKVFNDSNSGNYVLAVGDDDKVSFLETISVLFSIGEIKDEFWNPSLCN